MKMPGKKVAGPEPKPPVKWCVSLLNSFEHHAFDLLKETSEGIQQKKFWEIFQKKHGYSLFPPHMKTGLVTSEFFAQFPHFMQSSCDSDTSTDTVSLTEDAAEHGKKGLSAKLLVQCQHKKMYIEQEKRVVEIQNNVIRMMCNHPDGISLSEFWPEYYKIHSSSENHIVQTLGHLSPLAAIKKHFDDFFYVENNNVKLREGVEWMGEGPSAPSTPVGQVMDIVRGASIEATEIIKSKLGELVTVSIKQMDDIAKDISEEATKTYSYTLNEALLSLNVKTVQVKMETENGDQAAEHQDESKEEDQLKTIFEKLNGDDLRLCDAEIRKKNTLLAFCLEKESKQAIAKFTKSIQDMRRLVSLDFVNALNATVHTAFPGLKECQDAIVGGPALHALMKQRITTVLESYTEGITFDSFVEKHGEIFEVSKHPMKSINFFLVQYYDTVEFKSDSGKILLLKKMTGETAKDDKMPVESAKDDKMAVEEETSQEKSSENLTDKSEWKTIRNEVAQKVIRMVRERQYPILMHNIFVEYYIFYGELAPKLCNKAWTVLQHSDKKLVKKVEDGNTYVVVCDDANTSSGQMDTSVHESAEAVCETDFIPMEDTTPAERKKHWDDLKNNLPILLEEYPQGLAVQDLWTRYKEKFDHFPNRSILGIPKTKPIVKYFFDVIEEKYVNGYLCVFVKGKGPMEETLAAVKTESQIASFPHSAGPLKMPEMRVNILGMLKDAQPGGIPHQDFWTLYKKKFGRMPTRDELGVAKPKSLINAFADLAIISPKDGIPHVILNTKEGEPEITVGIKRSADTAGFEDEHSGKGKTQKQNSGEKGQTAVEQKSPKGAKAEIEPPVVQTMESMRKNVKQLLTENPQGITSHMLWQTYAKTFKMHPNKQQLGLNKTTSLISNLSDICEERNTQQGKLVFLKTGSGKSSVAGKSNTPTSKNIGRGRGKTFESRKPGAQSFGNRDFGGGPKKMKPQGGYKTGPMVQSPGATNTACDFTQLAPLLSSIIKSQASPAQQNQNQNQGKGRGFGRIKKGGYNERETGNRGRFGGGGNFQNRSPGGGGGNQFEKLKQLASYPSGDSSSNYDSYGQSDSGNSSSGYMNQGQGQSMQGRGSSMPGSYNSGNGGMSGSYNSNNSGISGSYSGNGNAPGSYNASTSNNSFSGGMNYSQPQQQPQGQDYDLRNSTNIYMQSMMSNPSSGGSLLSQSGGATSSMSSTAQDQWPNWQFQQ